MLYYTDYTVHKEPHNRIGIFSALILLLQSCFFLQAVARQMHLLEALLAYKRYGTIR